MKITRIFVTTMSLAVACASAGVTPAWDTSGDALLNGPYNFRRVVYDSAVVRGRIARRLLIYGTITFDGKGDYAILGTQVDTSANSGTPTAVSFTGTYKIAASGLGFLSDPVLTGNMIYGLVSNGVFIGGGTETGIHSLFIAAAATANVTTTAVRGGYYVTGMDSPTVYPTDIRDFWGTLSPDGSGSLGDVSLSGYVASEGNFPLSQVLPAVQYSFSNSVGTITAPTVGFSNTTLLSGNQTLYVSPDGGLFFGGSPTAFNMFVGVRATSTSLLDSEISNLYYQAGIDQDTTQIVNDFTGLSNYYGSFRPSGGLVVSHQRINALIYPTALDYSYADYYVLHADGTSSDSFQNYWFSENGEFRVGVGLSPYLGISVAAQAPTFVGSGVYINPASVVNAASFGPFTASLSPGEYVTLFGANLAPSVAQNSSVPVPTQLNGVQVFVNGTAAPVSYVSPSQVSFLIPAAASSIASIQLVNNGTASNTVTSFVGSTSPGVFTDPSGGIYTAAATHLNGTLVSENAPAEPGETVQLFVAGLGTVDPPVPDGSAGPVKNSSLTTNSITVFVDQQPAQVTYSGLAPTLAGVYQLNVVIPMGTDLGNVFIDVSGPDSYTSLAYIFIGNGAASSSDSDARRGSVVRRVRPRDPALVPLEPRN
jgi:uncharacterized protein (TIGR03437 family)